MFCFVERKDRVHTIDFITKVPSSLISYRNLSVTKQRSAPFYLAAAEYSIGCICHAFF